MRPVNGPVARPPLMGLQSVVRGLRVQNHNWEATAMSIFLGIDIGTSGTKTLAIDERGAILGSALETYPCYFPKPLWSEQDPDDWWQATIRSVRKTMAKAKLKPGDVKAIGLSGQMHGSVFLDKNNKVVRRAILWNDQRTAAECGDGEPRRRPGEPDQTGR